MQQKYSINSGLKNIIYLFKSFSFNTRIYKKITN